MNRPFLLRLRCLARLAMWWTLVFSQGGVAPAAAVLLAGVAGDHAVHVRPGREGMAIVLGHEADAPRSCHRHSAVSRLLVAFAQSNEAAHPDHELAFRTGPADFPDRLSVGASTPDDSAQAAAHPWFEPGAAKCSLTRPLAAPRAPPWLLPWPDRRVPGLEGIVMLI
jgi:hypothetical protein